MISASMSSPSDFSTRHKSPMRASGNRHCNSMPLTRWMRPRWMTGAKRVNAWD
jgi:hypothetical protein